MDPRKSTTCFSLGKWSRLLRWCCRRNITPCSATVHQIAGFFLWLFKELKLLMPAAKVYRAALNHVFAGGNLTANSRMFSIFEQTGLLRRIKPPEWNLFLVLKSFTCPPYELMKLSLSKHLTWKTCFLLALDLVK